ncbi:MAG: glycosyltransferase family 4 protein [Acidimicrobiales bacterium]
MGVDPIDAVLWMPRGVRISGGHVVQLEETARALEAYGVHARIDFNPEVDLAGADIVHGFCLIPVDVHHCRSFGIPVVVSPIYWDVHYGPDGLLTGASLRSVLGSFRMASRFLLASLRNGTRLTEACMAAVRGQMEMLSTFEAADLLLPNSMGEAESIRRDLGVTTPMDVVPNGVNPARFDDRRMPFEQRDVVLSVGRIDPHKNQLALIRALRGTGRKLVIVGYDHPDHPAYARACRKAGEGWVEFVGGKPQAELGEIFSRARVHVVASWFETTGLVSLEAALSGCSVVTTDRGHARQYFGDCAFYCDPADPQSIRQAVGEAWDHPPGPEVRQHVLDNFTWDHVARATSDAYRKVLGRRPPLPVTPATGP